MRETYNVIFHFYGPMEGGLTLEAESEDHAKELAEKLIIDRYKEAKVVEVYPTSESPMMNKVTKNELN